MKIEIVGGFLARIRLAWNFCTQTAFIGYNIERSVRGKGVHLREETDPFYVGFVGKLTEYFKPGGPTLF